MVLAGSIGPACASDVQSELKPGRLATLADGRKVNLRCSGSGRPTVILESGYGADSMAWTGVRARIERKFRVCAYDRAGYGFSTPAPPPRDGAAIAEDLDEALRAARIDGPFILVGHSAGGLYVRNLYLRRSADIAGMVLVDPTVEHQDRRFAEAFGPGAGGLKPLIARDSRCLSAAERGLLPSTDAGLAGCTPSPDSRVSAEINAHRLAASLRPEGWRTRISELDTLLGATSDEVAAGPPSYGDLPLVVLTADGTYRNVPEPARAAIDALWRGLHQELANRSTRGESRLVADSSHLIMIDKPQAVADAVVEVAAKAGGARR